MKKRIYKVLLFLLLMMPMYVNAGDFLLCGNEKKVPFIFGQLVTIVFIILKILVPLLLVITGMISFFKAVTSGKVDDELQKAKKAFINKLLAGIMIFFVASITNIALGLVAGRESSFSSCLRCMININDCDRVDSEIVQLCPGLLSQQKNYDSNCKYLADKGERKNYANTGNTGIPGRTPNTSNVGIFNGNGISGEFTTWKQTDSKWGSVTMGSSGVTLRKAGCLTTSLAIVMAKSGAVTDLDNFTPAVLAKTLHYGNNGCMSYWDDYSRWKTIAPSFRFVGKYSLDGKIAEKAAKIQSYLDDGKFVIISVRNGGHYVAADRVDGKTVYIHDPGCNATDLFKTYAVSGVDSILVYKRED